MPYKQSFENCFSESASLQNLSTQQFSEVQSQLLNIIEGLHAEKLPLFDFSKTEQKTAEIYNFCEQLSQKFNHLVVLGTGGSTLCGQCLVGLKHSQATKNKVTFVDNIDPITLQAICNNLELDNTAILTISKSGGTLEVLSQLIYFLNFYSEKLGNNKIKEHFFAISDEPKIDESPEKNTLRNIAEQFEIKTLTHENVGGRFSIFTNVGLIPAAFVGLDIAQILNGAEDVIKKLFTSEKQNSEPAKGAVFSYLLEKNYNSAIMMPYIDRLRKFNLWFAQIWAESLGKNGYGLTPIRALGSLDQHSQLQQFLDGKDDKIFNFIITKNAKANFAKLDTKILDLRSLDFLNDKNLGQIINVSAASTVASLKNHNRPVRVFELESLDEFAMGAICMHFILETVLVAKLAKIEPFGQPAVEEGKQTTLKILKS